MTSWHTPQNSARVVRTCPNAGCFDESTRSPGRSCRNTPFTYSSRSVRGCARADRSARGSRWRAVTDGTIRIRPHSPGSFGLHRGRRAYPARRRAQLGGARFRVQDREIFGLAAARVRLKRHVACLRQRVADRARDALLPESVLRNSAVTVANARPVPLSDVGTKAGFSRPCCRPVEAS